MLVSAFEKALLYFDGSELPINWNREELLGPEEDDGVEGDEVSCMNGSFCLPYSEQARFRLNAMQCNVLCSKLGMRGGGLML